jgi:hypothetical protein
MSSGFGDNSAANATNNAYRDGWERIYGNKEEMEKRQKEACGYMTPKEIGEAQRKAIEGDKQ